MVQYNKLTRSTEADTVIQAGHVKFTTKQMEDEMIDEKSEIGRKLKQVEGLLDYY